MSRNRICGLLAVLAALAGLYGLTMGALCPLVHLAQLESFGEPYLAPFAKVSGKGILRRRITRKQEESE